MRLQRGSNEGLIEDAKFKTHGCSAIVPSVVTEWVKGMIDEALEIKNKDIADHLALPPLKSIAQFSLKMRSGRRLKTTSQRRLKGNHD